MNTDSPTDFHSMSPRVRIIQRLVQRGISLDEFDEEAQSTFVTHVKSNGVSIPEIVFAILPSEEDALEAVWDGKPESETSWMRPSLRDIFQESISWLRWLMFEGDPVDAMNVLSEMSKGQRGVCGAVWGNNDIAYRCRSCENDPTCAICVPCFQNGVHKNHDYSIIYTGGGCCDCGDITAWKRDGFCSEHRGTDHIQSLPVEWKLSVGAVLDALLTYWRDKLLFYENIYQDVRINNDMKLRAIADEFSFVLIFLLLNFCQCSEGLLDFVSKGIISVPGLLDVIVKSEALLRKDVRAKHHELLLKLLGEPTFKYEFAKAFITYYPSVVKNVIEACSANMLKDRSFMSIFSVQIFTVPKLTLQLVKEMGLLEMLIRCLVDIFVSSAGEDGMMQISKWGSLFEMVIQIVGDIHFVLSHDEIPKYATHGHPEITRTWMKLLAFVHGANHQKRETNIHVEEENENTSLPFIFGLSVANINPLLVDEAFNAHYEDIFVKIIESSEYKPELDGGENTRHAKVGRLSQESSASTAAGTTAPVFTTKLDTIPLNTIPPTVLWLVYECVKLIDDLFEADNNAPSYNVNVGYHFSALRQALVGFVKENHVFKLPSVSQGHRQNLSFSRLSMARDIVDERTGMGQGKHSEMMYLDDPGRTPSDYSSTNHKLILEKGYFHLLSLADWPEISYDVSSQDASVHIPLHRLLSLLLHKTLKHFYGRGVVSLEAMNYDFFKIILKGCHPYGFSAFIMEHPLRNRVFCAQVHAGMWRRNGDSALLSCSWYCSVQWGGQDLEYDLFLLQCCAALAPSDLFVQRILERFGLSSYLSLNTERSSGYESVLVHEMLTLLIHIVKERRFSGLSTEESLRRELIFRLSLGDATHSNLLKSLPRDLSKSDKLQSILHDIASYSSPTGINQGMYSLKWECWRELDLYHPRSTSRELQVAEERYLRFCSVSAPVTQLPNWSKVYHPLSGIARVGTCATILKIVRAVIFYSVNSDNPTDSRAPDVVVLTALHLLALALDICTLQKSSRDMPFENGDIIPIIALAEEEVKVGCSGGGDQNLLSLLVSLMRSQRSDNQYCYMGAGNSDIPVLVECLLKRFAKVNSKCLIKLQKIAPEVVPQLVKPTSDSDVNIHGSERKIKSRERQAAIMAKMKAQQSRFLENVNSISDNKHNQLSSEEEEIEPDIARDSEPHVEDVCALCHDSNSSNSLSYLVLLQKSRLLSFVDRGPISWDGMDQLDNVPRSVIPNLLADISEIHAEKCLTSQSMDKFLLQVSPNVESGDMIAIMQFLRRHSIAFGKIPELCGTVAADGFTALPIEMLEEESFHTIFKEMEIGFNAENGDIVVVGGNYEKSESIIVGKYIAALSKESKESPFFSNKFFKYTDRDLLGTAQKSKEIHLFGPYDTDGINISSCGHAVHQECLDRYLCSLKERYNRRISFEGRHIVDPDKGEFLCPVCRRLANSVLPICNGSGQRIQMIPDCTNTRLMHQISSAGEKTSLFYLQHALSLMRRAADVTGSNCMQHTFPPGTDGRIDLDLKPLLQTLHDMYFSGKLDKVSQPVRTCYSMIMWDTVTYSIMSMEVAARSRKTLFKPSYATSSLYDGLESTNGFIMSMFLRAAQNFRTMRSVEALQRFIGVQLLNKSICLETYEGDFFGNSHPQDNAINILKLAEKEVPFHDVQFWKRCSDPVLSHDPFSSLMLVLFCLPYPFLVCQQSFIYLVHLFYAVSITQAAVTYVSKYRYEIRKEDLPDCLADDIYNLLCEARVSRQNFASNYLTDFSSFYSIIRSLSFPYLRRCVLLWKLIKFSAKTAFANTIGASENIYGDVGSEELFEEEKLRKFFMIPPLEFSLKDVLLRSLSSKWCRHFYEITECCNPKYVLYSTPVVPFKLVKLPDMYQVLLERYINTHFHDCKPALCLLCGKLCSSSFRPCCGKKIGCQAHAAACGSGTGVFLLIRKTTILLQRSARKSHWPSPYLDSHGEEDIELRRGNPLYLNEERYATLAHMVASHGLDQSSNVLGRTTVGTLFMA